MINLQQGEKVLYQDKPKPLVLVIWVFTKIIGVSIVSWVFLQIVFFGIIGSVLNIKDLFATFFNYSIYTLIIIFIVVLIYNIFLIKTYEYYVTNQRVVFKGGILLRRLRSVPFYKITDVEISQNILEQALKISKLHMHTAGTGGPMAEISFIGLEDANTPEKIINNALKRYKGSSATSE